MFCESWAPARPDPTGNRFSRLHPSNHSSTSLKSNYSRTYEPFSCNSNYSRTYAIPRGRGISWSNLQASLEMSARRHFLPQRVFFHFPTLATDRVSRIASRNSFHHVSYAKTGGYGVLVIPIQRQEGRASPAPTGERRRRVRHLATLTWA
jgi:hypothetical protein